MSTLKFLWLASLLPLLMVAGLTIHRVRPKFVVLPFDKVTFYFAADRPASFILWNHWRCVVLCWDDGTLGPTVTVQNRSFWRTGNPVTIDTSVKELIGTADAGQRKLYGYLADKHDLWPEKKLGGVAELKPGKTTSTPQREIVWPQAGLVVGTSPAEEIRGLLFLHGGTMNYITKLTADLAANERALLENTSPVEEARLEESIKSIGREIEQQFKYAKGIRGQIDTLEAKVQHDHRQ